MGTSFVSIGDKGFWMRDAVLCLWLRMVALQIECGGNDADALTRLRNEWMLQSQIAVPGVVATNLDTIADDETAKQAVSAAIHRVLKSLSAFGDAVEPETLNLLGLDVWAQPEETSRLRTIGTAFLDLLEGKITTEADSTDFMPGSKP